VQTGLHDWMAGCSAPGSRRTVIFAHGRGDNKLDTLGPDRLASPWQTAIEARGRALVAAARGDLGTASASLERALAAHERLRRC
jgi:hypothetical protein